LRRDDVLLAAAAGARRWDAAIFVGNGNNARAMATLDDRPQNFYMVGSMGEYPCVAAGFAARSRTPVIAIEGDGNALMGMSGWPAVRATAARSFVHVVLDNGVYETTGSQLTLAHAVDLPAVADRKSTRLNSSHK
jgi:thiamine pyrophosphate-dependent acetolactate synthase large subunit-like protein